MRNLLAAALFLGAALIPTAHAAETLYAASVRGYNAGAEAMGLGMLYVIDPATAAATRIGPISTGDKTPLGVTGLAFHPVTGVLYGITAGLSANTPHSLVTVDPKTGEATVVGSLGVIGSDISFDADGKLHMWVPSLRQVGLVNLQTGTVSLRGEPGTAGPTGGLSIDKGGEILVAGTGSTSRLDSIDPQTGELKRGPPLVNAPYPAINSLTISSRGVIYAVNSNLGAPASTRLVTIDRKTGEVRNIGALPSDTDALAFRPASAGSDFNWTPILIALGVIVTLVTLVFTIVRPKPR